MKDNTITIDLGDNQKRKDWSESFQGMAKNGDDELLIPDVFEDEDLSDWIWKEV